MSNQCRPRPYRARSEVTLYAATVLTMASALA